MPRPSRGRGIAAAGVGLILLGLGVTSMAAVAGEPVSRGEIPVADVGHGSAAPPGGLRPVAVAIPAIDVDASIVDLRREPSGELHGPKDYDAVGWWSESVGIGRNAPMIMLGHVDNRRLPKVFKRLRQLRPGDEIQVAASDARSTTYVVDAVRQYDKDSFPTDLVYGRTARPTLRLLTCGGYSWLQGHRYRDNVVVFAHLLDGATQTSSG